MTIKASHQELECCCGVDEIGNFEYSTYGSRWRVDLAECIKFSQAGTGYFIATFIDNEVCKKAYHDLCEKATLMYQSPPRFNPRHGENEVFVCVFLSKVDV